MKYINKFTEDIDWDWVEEEINEIDFQVGDYVCLNNIEGNYKRSQSEFFITNSTLYIERINKLFVREKNVIEKILYTDDNEMVFKLVGKWPWYISKYWKKI